MTRQEAIEILKGDFSNVILNENESHSDLFTEAFNMAIEALKADVPDINVGNTSGRLTEYHQGVAVIKNKDFKAAAEKLAWIEDAIEKQKWTFDPLNQCFVIKAEDVILLKGGAK